MTDEAAEMRDALARTLTRANSAEELLVLRRVQLADGSISLEELVDWSELGEQETTTALERLVQLRELVMRRLGDEVTFELPEVVHRTEGLARQLTVIHHAGGASPAVVDEGLDPDQLVAELEAKLVSDGVVNRLRDAALRAKCMENSTYELPMEAVPEDSAKLLNEQLRERFNLDPGTIVADNVVVYAATLDVAIGGAGVGAKMPALYHDFQTSVLGKPETVAKVVFLGDLDSMRGYGKLARDSANAAANGAERGAG